MGEWILQDTPGISEVIEYEINSGTSQAVQSYQKVLQQALGK